MSNDLALSHLFCEKHPSDAASILVRLPPEFVSGFLTSMAPTQSIHIIQHMPTAYATQLLSYFEQEYSARLLANADFPTAARLLRPLPKQQRDQLMSDMGTTQNAQLARILNYPPGSVGNLVEIPVFTALGDWTVKHTQQELKKIRHRSISDFPVVDDEHRFLGSTNAHVLLTTRDNMRLDDLCTGKNLALPAYATIVSILHHAAWEKSLSIPVVDRGGILLGLLHRSALNTHIPGSPGTRAQEAFAPVMALAELYWATSSSIIEMIGKKASQNESK